MSTNEIGSRNIAMMAFWFFIALLTCTGIAQADSLSADSPTPAGVVEMKAAKGETHHIEVKPETLEAYRIPGMKITVSAFPEDGGPAIVKQLDEMFGGNFHYGANFALEPKKYVLKFHLEPPTFMREGKRAGLWLTPIDAEYPFDAALSVEKNGDIGTKTTSDMKIIFAAEAAESMFVLPGQNGSHDEATGHEEAMDHMHDDEVPVSTNSGGSTTVVVAFATILGFVLGRFFFKTK